MTTFQDKWAKPPTQSMGERFDEAVRPKGPLKPQIQTAISNLQKQISKLDGMLGKMRTRDAQLFKQIVDATQSHEMGTARTFSSELAEVRKVIKMLSNARMSLERISLRLTTANDIGDTVVTIMPAISLMNGMRTQLGRIMPGADQEMSNMADMLGSMMTDTFTSDTAFGSDTSMTEEAEKILSEASSVAATAVDSRFPITPTETGSAVSDVSDSKYM